MRITKFFILLKKLMLAKNFYIYTAILQMRPLAAFRPYVEDVHTIVVLDVASALNEYIRNHKDFVSIASLGRRSFDANRSGSGNDPSENVSCAKDRVSQTVDRFRQDTAECVSSLDSYVITIGNGYRFVYF